MNDQYKISSLLIECQYFGNIDSIISLFKSTHVEIEQYETYPKSSFRNRMVLVGATGPIEMSVPIIGGRSQKALSKDVRIDHTSAWQKIHWRTIYSCYSRAPFYEYYADWLAGFYEKRYDFLLDMNMDILLWLKSLLKCQTQISRTNSFQAEYPNTVIDRRDYWLPKNYRESASTPVYTQVFSDRIGFVPNLSFLDALCCIGAPGIKQWLQDNKTIG